MPVKKPAVTFPNARKTRGRPRGAKADRDAHARVHRLLTASQDIHQRLAQLPIADARSVALSIWTLYRESGTEDSSPRAGQTRGDFASALPGILQPSSHILTVLAALHWLEQGAPDGADGYRSVDINQVLKANQLAISNLSARLVECRKKDWVRVVRSDGKTHLYRLTDAGRARIARFLPGDAIR